ncbi:amino acid permease [Priestia aryabhattai]|uniref:amino acid permease n=1 Tax=Priestia TaxID=2800373 RepID=UPI0013F67DDE|nr:amino acid permease [Priestia aryabhattai]MCL6708792.1 amino acid permease [Pseudomonas sp. R2.Fl]NHH95706.1 Amino-acid permease RocE [Bacillus sp. MB95]MCM2974937.1 amino acid permease [Priestia aryabhattai]MDT0147410.1 amino acid permease [Priestia aryabhattai]MDT0152259.1 amino acid permease [Priestia aryabhattai]
MNIPQGQPGELKRTMKTRHLFMISLGGCIGTGFFLGSGYTINEAGPMGAMISYLVGGIIMYLTMLCLGELSVAMPVAGSFQTYSTKFIGPATGFAIGWLYWLGWAVTVALEFLAAGQLMQRWFPGSPVWLWCAIFGALIFSLNALSAKAFGETEFWFSSVKIFAIIMFIVVGGAAMFGFIDMKSGQEAPLLSNFFAEGLFPNGVTALLITMITVNFSFQGTELIGIAAGESENPEKTIPKAIKQTVWRTLFFFVLSVFVLASMIPREKAGVVESPFVVVLDSVGVPYAADIMNFIILTALLSVANSGFYAATRMLYSLSREGMASPALGKVNKRGVPFNALLITLVISCFSLLSSVVAAKTVFVWLISLAGLGAQIGWIAITASLLAFRRAYVAKGGKVEDLKFRTPLYPVLPIVALITNCIVMISLAFDPEQRMALYCGGIFFIGCYVYYYLKIRKQNQSKQEQEVQLAENKRMII